MWRYIAGVKRPLSARSQSAAVTTTLAYRRCQQPTSSSSDDDEEDESSQSTRHFVTSWKDSFSWLDFDCGKMYCTLCKTCGKKNIFGQSGSTNFRRSALIDHSKSSDHTDAVRSTLEATQAASVFTAVRERAEKAILTLLKAAYFVAKEDVAILKFDELINLLERCDCPDLPRELYRNRDGCHEFVTVIGDCIESDMVELMCNSPYLGIMIDESTDLSVRKNLLLYVNAMTSSGDVNSYFANITEMKHCDANALTEAIVEYLREKKIDVSRVSGLGSDGASVMTGRHNGVGAKLKKLNPFMLSMHCVAHKLALASENAASQVPYCRQHHSTLKGLYNFFHTSPNHYSALKEMMEILNDPVVHIQQVHTIRWLTMHRAVEAVRKCFPSLLSTLSAIASAENDPVAKGLYDSIRSYKFIMFTHFLCDILGNLTFLSCFFQQDNLDFSQVQSAVEGTISNIIETYLDQDNEDDQFGGENLQKIREELSSISYPLIFDDHEIVQRDRDECECFASMRSFANAVISNLEDRFPDLPVWSSFKIFDPQSYPSKVTQLRGFGEENVKILLKHFGEPKVIDEVVFKEVVNPAGFQREWPIFKRTVYDNYRGLSFKELSKEIITKKATSFPVISKLLQFIIVLPMSSVPCERGFSRHNHIRTKYRQQLTVSTVKSLMHCSVNGPNPAEYDYSKPLQEWKRHRNRHVFSCTENKLVK